MNYEDLKWINQSLWSHKDKSYDSHGYLDLSVSINTSDDITFSQPKLVFNLDNQGQRRNVRLGYSDVVDLILSLHNVSKNKQEIYSNPQTGDVTKRYNQDKDLVFEFRMIPNTSIPVVAMKIVHNHSDEGKIILSYEPDFITIDRIARMFVTDYIKLNIDLPSRYLQSLSVNRLNSIETLIKILPTHFTPNQNTQTFQQPSSRSEPKDVNVENDGSPTNYLCAMCNEPQFETTSGLVCKNGHGGAGSIEIEGVPEPVEQNEFEQFSEENIDSVRIPELEEGTTMDKIEPIQQGVHSPFIGRLLKNNIHNLEEMLIALTTNNNPLLTIMDTLHQGQPYTLLPGISESDLKSTAYISNLYFKLTLQSYLQNQTVFPSAVPVVKYQGDNADRQTIELSYDLLMISAYLKLYRNRMESINSDPYTNGAIVHFAFRCWLDVATYSYLSQSNSEAVKSCVMTRFNTFRESGFFDYYDELLVKNGQLKINEPEISEFLDKVFNNVVDSDNIDKRHFNAHDMGNVPELLSAIP